MAREGQGYPRWRRDMMMMMMIYIYIERERGGNKHSPKEAFDELKKKLKCLPAEQYKS